MTVQYGWEHPRDRARSYAAAMCEECHDFDDLKLQKDKTFLCGYCRGERSPYTMRQVWQRTLQRNEDAIL